MIEDRSGFIITFNCHPREGGDPGTKVNRALCLILLLDSAFAGVTARAYYFKAVNNTEAFSVNALYIAVTT